MARDVLTVLALALGAALLRVGVRERDARAVEAATGVPAALVLPDSPSAYRLRLAELTLETGTVPRADRMVAPRAGTAVPWPPLGTRAIAALAQRAQPADREATLAGVARWLPPALAAVATALLYAAARAAGAARGAALVAAAAFGLAAPDGAPGDLSMGAAAAGAVLVAATAALRMARARDVADLALDALVAGFAAAAACLLDLASAPAVALVLGALAVAAARREERTEPLVLGAILAVAAGGLAVELGAGGPSAPGDRFDPAGGLPTLAFGALAGWGLAWLVLRLAAERADPVPVRGRALAAGLAVLVPAAAALLEARDWLRAAVGRRGDADPAAIALAGAGLAGAVLAARLPRAGRAALAVVALGLGLLLGPGPGLGGRGALEDRARVVRELRRLRDGAPSAGPWNHPDARQSWHVDAPPEVAGLVVWHARRPAGRAPWSGAPTTAPAFRLDVPDARVEPVERPAPDDRPEPTVSPR